MGFILGIWDGHDSGAALIRDGAVVAAVNEERFTRRKLEVCFPVRSIETCLAMAGIKREEVEVIAASTADPAKTLTRFFPGLKENYYQIRRRKKFSPYVHLSKRAKFWITAFGPSRISRFLSQTALVGRLRGLGFKDFEFFLVDHHAAHAACAAFCSPFENAAVITVDGVGDGLSATFGAFGPDGLRRIADIPASGSLGLFFEQVTFLLNMRELEDEGKVMSLADLSNLERENPMMDLFRVEGTSVKARYSPSRMFSLLEEMAFKLPWEKFAWMAQRTLEAKLLELFQNGLRASGQTRVAWAGGIAANVKANQKIRLHSGLKEWFVFPHMGDGGTALGAALCAREALGETSRVTMHHVYLGPSFPEDRILRAAAAAGAAFSREDRIEEKSAKLLADGNILLWFQGRMEFGPRALGNRSILAPPGDLNAKESLNRILKRRSWFQPFCPTLLFEEAPNLLEDWDGLPSPFMTMAYHVRPGAREGIGAAIASDGSCRPQILQDENPVFRRLLEEYKRITSKGYVLNTSFNRHGEPLVCTPEEALAIFLEAGFPYLIMDRFLFENPRRVDRPKSPKALAAGGSAC